MRQMTIPQLNVAIHRELSHMADNEVMMQYALSSLRKIRREHKTEVHDTDEEIIKNLMAVKEDAELIRSGKMVGRPVEEFLAEL